MNLAIHGASPLQANAEETLRAAFLPFTLESHVCCIVFEDLQCGKFVYEVSGETRPPPVFKEYKFQVKQQTSAWVHVARLLLLIG